MKLRITRTPPYRAHYRLDLTPDERALVGDKAGDLVEGLTIDSPDLPGAAAVDASIVARARSIALLLAGEWDGEETIPLGFIASDTGRFTRG